VLRSGSAGEVQGRDYWGSRCAGMCSKIAGPRPTKPPRICRTALTRAAAAPVHKRTDSVQHDPPPNRPRICAQCYSQAAATGRADRLQAAGAESCERTAGWNASKWSGTAPSAGSSTVRLRRQQRTASDLTIPERRCQPRRWRHQITRPHALYQSRIGTIHTEPKFSISSERSGCGTSSTAATRNGGIRRPKQRSGDKVRMKLSASTPRSISHHRCLPVRPDSRADFIVAAHYAISAHMG
jgi:hypothetical protein